jgi:cytoskeletal protein RodZ
MIQDAIDEGQDEKSFIMNLGSIDSIIANIVKDEEFVKDVKTSNSNSLGNIVSHTVRVISLVCYYFVLIILSIIFASFFISGLGMIGQSLIYLIFDAPTSADLWILLGVIMMGLGISIISSALIFKTFKFSSSIRLHIIRKTKEIFRNKR